MAKPKLSEIDFISKRYSRLPSEILKLDLSEYEFNLLVCSIGMEAESKIQEKAMKRGNRGPR